jgi:hypothetical protein
VKQRGARTRRACRLRMQHFRVLGAKNYDEPTHKGDWVSRVVEVR